MAWVGRNIAFFSHDHEVWMCNSHIRGCLMLVLWLETWHAAASVLFVRYKCTSFLVPSKICTKSPSAFTSSILRELRTVHVDPVSLACKKVQATSDTATRMTLKAHVQSHKVDLKWPHYCNQQHQRSANGEVTAAGELCGVSHSRHLKMWVVEAIGSQVCV